MKVRILAAAMAAMVGTVTAVALLPQKVYAAEARAIFTEEQLKNPIPSRHIAQMLASGNGAKLATRAGVNGSTCSAYPVFLQSRANWDLYVTVEMGYTGSRQWMVRARGEYAGPWQEFEECWWLNNNGRLVHTYRSLYNWRFITVEYDYAGGHKRMLRARSTYEDIWQRFYVGVPDNWNMTLESVHIGYYVSVELDYTGQDWAMMRARATSVGTWEIFGQS